MANCGSLRCKGRFLKSALYFQTEPWLRIGIREGSVFHNCSLTSVRNDKLSFIVFYNKMKTLAAVMLLTFLYESKQLPCQEVCINRETSSAQHECIGCSFSLHRTCIFYGCLLHFNVVFILCGVLYEPPRAAEHL